MALNTTRIVMIVSGSLPFTTVGKLLLGSRQKAEEALHSTSSTQPGCSPVPCLWARPAWERGGEVQGDR